MARKKVIPSEDQKIIAVIAKNADGRFEILQEARLNRNDVVTLITVPQGIVAVIGALDAEDGHTLLGLLSEFQ